MAVFAEDHLWTLENRLWSGGADIYRQNLHRDCLMAFAHPAGVMTYDAIIKAISIAPRWRDVAITERVTMTPREDVAVLGYRVWASREASDAYAAICSSTWLDEGGLWRLVQHQQSPMKP